MQLPVADVESDHRRGAVLEQAVGETARRRADVEARGPADVDAEHVERVLELLPAPRDVPRRRGDGQLDVLVELLPGLRVTCDPPGQDERLRLRAGLGETAFDEEDIEPLLHAEG